MFVNPLIKCTILFVPIFTVVIIGAIGRFFCGISMIKTIAFFSVGACFLPPPTMFAMPEVHIQSSFLFFKSSKTIVPTQHPVMDIDINIKIHSKISIFNPPS